MSTKAEVPRRLGKFFHGITVEPTLKWSWVTFGSYVEALKNTPTYIHTYMQKMMPVDTLIECEDSWKVRFFVRMRTTMCFKPVNELQCLLQRWKLGWFVQGLVCFVNSVHLTCGSSCVWSGVCSFFCHTVYWVISSVVLILICERYISVTLLVSNEACIGETYSVTFITYKLIDKWINYFSSCMLDICKTHSYIHTRSD